MKGKLLLGAGVALTAAALYAAAGYWLAPRLLRGALQERAAALGLTLSMGEVRTDPFRLAVELAGVELADAAGKRLAAARDIRLDIAWASLWRDAWVVQRATVLAPQAEVLLGPQGAINWPVPDAAANGADAGDEARALRVRALSVSEGTLKLVDRSRAAPVDVTLQGLDVEAENLDTRKGEAPYRLRAELAQGGTLESDGTFSLGALAAHGKLALAGVPLAKAWRLAAPAADPAEGRLSAHSFYAYEEGRLVLLDVHAEAAPAAYAGVELRKVALDAPKLAFPVLRSVELAAQVELAQGGSVSARGSVQPRPLSAELQLEVRSLPVALVQRLLPESVAVNITAGNAGGSGRVRVAGRRVTYEGSADIAGLKLEERDSKQLLLGWKRARTEELKLAASPPAIEVGELLVQAPQGRIAIEADGRVNFGEAFKGGGQRAAHPFGASVRRLRIEDGTLDFADRSLETPFEVTVRELSGSLTGFSTGPGDAARVELTGRVGKYGSARIGGTIDVDQPKSLANITARLRNLDLAQLTPYVVKFAGYRVRSGRASADLRYRVRDGRLSGQNRLVLQQLQIGEKVEGAGASDLPLDLAVAILTDAKGRISLDIPVRGDLSDPQFDFGGLIGRALGNAIGKIVSAPFRALAGLFDGGDEDLSDVRFEAGSAALSPPQQESVAKVAQALLQRPGLAITVRGGYDPARDTAVLRREAARREIAQRAGYKSDGPLDFSDPQTLRAAESLYLERIGNRLNLQALRKEAPRYGRALLERLAFILPDEVGDAEKLARERAQSVRAALIEHGVEPARVTLQPPAAAELAGGGVPTELALSALGHDASVGPTAAAAP